MAEKLNSCMSDYAEQAQDVAEFTNTSVWKEKCSVYSIAD